MEKFHIEITDNETGEKLVNTDSGAIIGAIDEEDGGTNSLAFVSCKGSALMATVVGAKRAINGCLEDVPLPIRLMIKALSEKETNI